MSVKETRPVAAAALRLCRCARMGKETVKRRGKRKTKTRKLCSRAAFYHSGLEAQAYTTGIRRRGPLPTHDQWRQTEGEREREGDGSVFFSLPSLSNAVAFLHFNQQPPPHRSERLHTLQRCTRQHTACRAGKKGEQRDVLTVETAGAGVVDGAAQPDALGNVWHAALWPKGGAGGRKAEEEDDREGKGVRHGRGRRVTRRVSGRQVEGSDRRPIDLRVPRNSWRHWRRRRSL